MDARERERERDREMDEGREVEGWRLPDYRAILGRIKNTMSGLL